MDSAKPLRRFIANLVVLLCLGVLILGWFTYYTDLFPMIGGLLGLGGVFAWVAFLSGLVSGDRKKELQALFENKVLDRRWLWLAALGTGGAIMGVGPLWCGTILIDSQRDAVTRSVQIARLSEDRAFPKADQWCVDDAISPFSTKKFCMWVGSWRPQSFVVKVSGLPALEVKLGPLTRKTLLVPREFYRQPVLIVRPGKKLIENSRQIPQTFRLCINGVTKSEWIDYKAQTVWVGCDKDVIVPAEIREKWDLEGANPQLIAQWLRPRVAYDGLLTGSERIMLVVLRADGVCLSGPLCWTLPLKKEKESDSKEMVETECEECKPCGGCAGEKTLSDAEFPYEVVLDWTGD